MYTDFLKDPNFFLTLLKIDKDIIEIASCKLCEYCGGQMDRSDFSRKPRGGPDNLPDDFCQRFSLCCRQEGCRKRNTPDSVRFFKRRRWLAPIFFVASILRGDCNPSIFKEFCDQMGIDKRVATRWRRWWQESFPSTGIWQKIQGFFTCQPSPAQLPEFIFHALSMQSPPSKKAVLASLKLLSCQII